MIETAYLSYLLESVNNSYISTRQQVLVYRVACHTAARLLEAMDPSVDPCEDFFEYACGTWNRINVIPNDKPKYDTFRKLGDELQTSLKGIRLHTPFIQFRL